MGGAGRKRRCQVRTSRWRAFGTYQVLQGIGSTLLIFNTPSTTLSQILVEITSNNADDMYARDSSQQHHVAPSEHDEKQEFSLYVHQREMARFGINDHQHQLRPAEEE